MGRKPKLDDPDLRARFCDQVRSGLGMYEAAAAVGIAAATYREYYKKNPDFREEVEAARDASVEPVLKMLREEALMGDLSAAKEWLKHVAPPSRGEQTKKVEVEHTHQLDPNTVQSIEDLRARLEGRSPAALPEPVIEGEVIDDDDDDD